MKTYLSNSEKIIFADIKFNNYILELDYKLYKHKTKMDEINEYPKITKFYNSSISSKILPIPIIPVKGRSLLSLLYQHHLRIYEIAQSANNIFKIGDEVRAKSTSRIRVIKSFEIDEQGLFYVIFEGNPLAHLLYDMTAKLEDLF
jgi:hypothetical protein